MTVGTELLNAPFPQMVRNLGVGIAEAQLELDMVSLKIARMMAGYDVEDDEEESLLDPDKKAERKYLVKFGDGQEYSMLELGFTPTFYQFVDTVIEIKLSISITSETKTERRSSTTKARAGGFALPFFAGGSMSVSSVSASFASRYQYSSEGSSVMRTKLVPLPAPALLEERIRAMIAARTPATP